MVLGLDLASGTSGVVLVDLETGEIFERDYIAATASWHVSRRVQYIAGALVQWITEPRVVDIWAENYGTRYVHVAAAMGRMHQAVAQTIVDHSPLDRRIDQAFGLLAPKAIKVHATGRGGATKAEMIAAARRRWPRLVDATDDEADAAWVADLGASHFRASMAASKENDAIRG